jgi:hypothetical protein
MLRMVILNSILYLSLFTLSPPRLFHSAFYLCAFTYPFHVEAEHKSAGCNVWHLHEQTVLASLNEEEVKKTLWPLAERPPLVGEASANFCG